MSSTEQTGETKIKSSGLSKKKIIGIVTLIVLVALVTTGIILVFTVFKYKLFPKRWGVVDASMVYRSGRLDPYLIEKTLEKNGVKTIMNLTGSKNYPASQPQRKAGEKLGIDIHYKVMGGDGIGKLEDYIYALQVIDKSKKENKPVLVHCSAGTNRTGAVIALYRMLIQKMSPEKTFEEMLQYNFDPVDNASLIVFLNKNMQYFAEELKKVQLIDEVPDPLPQLPSK